MGFNVKCALNDTTLPIGGGGSGKEPIGVRKGTQVSTRLSNAGPCRSKRADLCAVLSLMGMQRREDIVGPDGHLFRPERWETWNPEQWQFIPFNHGIRTCLGQKFGQQQVEYALARIAQEFDDIRVSEDQREQEFKVELNVKPLHPCMCRFVRSS